MMVEQVDNARDDEVTIDFVGCRIRYSVGRGLGRCVGRLGCTDLGTFHGCWAA